MFVDIRYFLQDAAETPSIVTKYIAIGGRPLEFAQTLNKIDRDELFHISYVFRGIHLLLIEILNTSKDISKERETIEACAYVLNNHRGSIEKLLNSNVLAHKKAVLKLLTAMVYLAPHLGRELLTSFNAVFNSESLMKFTSHDRLECQLADEERVRTCYIHFVMAYIIEGNPILVKNLLDRAELVMAVVSGLVYDSPKTVCLVMNALQKFVLRAEAVSKTKKVHVFSQSVIKELLKLFEWKGPDFFRAQFNKKLKPNAESLVQADDVALVNATTLEFLEQLLASRKHGIAFRCLGQRNTKFNTAQKRVLLWLDNFWEHEAKGDLIVEILRACPELTKYFVQKHASRLDPNKKLNNWHKFSAFISRVVDQLSPDIVQYHLNDMNAKEVTDLIKEVCLAPEILQQTRGKQTLKSEDLSIRLKTTKLLYRMLKQCNQYLLSLAQRNVYSANDLKKIKFELINHVLLLFPSVENILLSLHMTQMDENANSDEVFEHLECILDLLLLITSSIPSFIDTTSSVINYIKILGPLYESNRDLDSSTRIELKAVKLMLALEPKALSPKTELFEQVLQSFFNVFRLGSDDERRDAKMLLRNVFQNTGLFDNGQLEIDLWLNALNSVAEDDLSDVKEFIIQILNDFDAANCNYKLLDDMVAGVNGENRIAELFQRIESGDTQEGYLDVPSLSNFYRFAVATANASDTDAVRQYVEELSFQLFHYLPKPSTVYAVLKGGNNKYLAYMKSWIEKGTKGKLPAHIKTNLFARLYAALTDEPASFLEVFADVLCTPPASTNGDEPASDKPSTLLTIKIDDQSHAFVEGFDDESQVMTFVCLTTFVANQAHVNGTLTTERCAQIVEYLKRFVDILQAVKSRRANDSDSGFAVSNTGTDCVAKFLKYIYNNCLFLLDHFDIWAPGNNITVLIHELTAYVKDIDYVHTVSVHYRKKTVKQIEAAIGGATSDGNIPSSSECKHLQNLLELFQPDHDECCAILRCLSTLPAERFVSRDNQQSIFGVLWSTAITNIAKSKTKALDIDVVQKLIDVYVDLLQQTKVEINFENIDTAWLAYLSTYGQFIGDSDSRIFEAIFECKVLNKSNIKLACLLLERNAQLADTFVRLLAAHANKKELIYPVINVVAQAKLNIDAALLASLYSSFKNGITKAIERPQKAALIYRENIISSVFLIEKCMPLKECIDFMNKNTKYESADVFQLQIVKSIYLKVLMGSNNPDEIRKCYQSFLAVLLQLLSTILKRDQLDYVQVNAFATIAYQWVQLKRKWLPAEVQSIVTYDNICGSPLWLQFGKLCLKNALNEVPDAIAKQHDERPAVLLKLFGFLCDELYKANTNNDDAKTFFEMATTHHAFFDVTVLQLKSDIKTYLMYAIYVLITKDARSLEASHLPVFLSGYQAKLSHCDRYILAIMQLYEKNGIDLHKYRPFIWGESALSHYSLAEATTVKTTLFQEPPMMQMMALIERDLSENTLVNFPMWRRLNTLDQVPSVEFKYHGIAGDDQSDTVSIAKSNIEKLIEAKEVASPDVLQLAAHRDETYDNVYDPAFVLPLMQMAFAPEATTKPVRPAQNGLLAITFAALSSCDKSMRLAASTALQRYRSHMDTARFADSKLWFHMFESLQSSLAAYAANARNPSKMHCPRVPYIAGLFFARLINTLQTPLNEMYRPLSAFLLIRSSINFLSVPEFNVLFHSPDVNHHVHRAFILETIRDGLKCGGDYQALITTDVLKALLGFYGSPMSSRDIDFHILSAVNAALKIPVATKTMIDSVGILAWLNVLVENVEFFQFDFIDLLCTAISNLHHSVRINHAEYRNSALFDIDLRCLNLLLKLGPKLSTRINEMPFLRYVNILEKVATTTATGPNDSFLGENVVDHLLKCAEGYLSDTVVADLQFLKNNANAHCDRTALYCRRLREQGVKETSVFLAARLRDIIVHWIRAQRKQNQ